MDNKRKPVLAGGQPTPAAIANAETKPPVGDTASAATQPEGETSTEPVTPEDEAELVEARVLVAFGEHAPDDIVTGSANAIEQMKLDGRADPHPDAVAYARSLQA